MEIGIEKGRKLEKTFFMKPKNKSKGLPSCESKKTQELGRLVLLTRL